MALAQDPAALLEAAAKQGAMGGAGLAVGVPAADAVPRPVPAVGAEQPGDAARLAQAKEDQELRQAKAKDKGPRRFAADLFDARHPATGATDGGISEDYVLGAGDRLQMSVFGSATFELPLAVDGRGEVVIPRVGTVPVAGKSLAKARAAVEAKVRQVFSRTTVDLSVTRLREVRVFVLGEVYRPGSFLVPSLSSLVNVLGLAGGPTSVGSFRQVRVVRGGRTVFTADLYPLRAEGLGNLNLGLQNGDTVFVPLAQNLVRLEGAFTRVAATVPETKENGAAVETDEEKGLKRNIRRLELRLGVAPKAGAGEDEADGGRSRTAPEVAPAAQAAAILPGERAELEERLEVLKDELKLLKAKARGDKRVEEKLRGEEFTGQPRWLTQWLQDGKAPVMQFELLPTETVQDALRFAGGFALQSFAGAVSLRRIGADGSQTVLEVPAAAMAATVLQRGDVLTALPRRDPSLRSVTVSGWTRVQGPFAREEGQRVGGLLKRHGLVLPDTYLERGELVHVLADGTKRFTAFHVGKALAGDPGHDLPLQDRDEVELYRVGDLRLPQYLKVNGPVLKPGTFEFIPGMRAADLLFRAGVPLEKADRLVAELGRTRDGKPLKALQLDLTRLLSTEKGSPVDLKDDAVNPLLEPNDQLSVFAKPDYRPHRTITLSGQVARPGIYELDVPNLSLRDLIARAGGLTGEAMPRAGVFLRTLGPTDPERKRASILAGVENDDPTSNGINEILGRLNETKRMPLSGALLNNPLLHGLTSGALNRLVVDFEGLLKGDPAAEVELQDGDEIIIPRRTDVAYVVGETASPFAAFKVARGAQVKDLVAQAGGYTRNADTWNVRLLKANGRVVDSWVGRQQVEPGDAILVPQRIRRDVSWQENLQALTPLAILINTFK